MDRKDNKGNENRAKKHRSKKNQQSHGTKRRGNHNRDGDTGTANPNNDGGKAKKSKHNGNGTVTGHFSTHRQQSQQCAIGEEVVIGTTLTLKWERPFRPVSIEAEEQLLPLLLRYAEKERGMMKSHHPRRVQSIRGACRESHMTLDQGLSMRRMHMMYLNPQISNTFQLHLGRPEDVRRSAALFEHSVAQYLSRQGLRFLSEEQQKASIRIGEKTPPTPDFLFEEPVHLHLVCHSSHTAYKSKNHKSKPVALKWIEAKMFYGASTIPDGSRNAVGSLLRTVRRYVEHHGPGAFVFSFGFGIRIKTMLEAEGAFVLDAKPLDLGQMRTHQRTWCANDRGHILP